MLGSTQTPEKLRHELESTGRRQSEIRIAWLAQAKGPRHGDRNF
jgi:hypothetical protein